MYRYILRESCSQFDSLPLTSLTILRTLRLADGPDEVHARTVSRLELHRQDCKPQSKL